MGNSPEEHAAYGELAKVRGDVEHAENKSEVETRLSIGGDGMRTAMGTIKEGLKRAEQNGFPISPEQVQIYKQIEELVNKLEK